MRIAFISPFWLPKFGGAEQYEHRLGLALIERGFEVAAFSATPEQAGRDNGRVPVTRWKDGSEFKAAQWGSAYKRGKSHLPMLFRHYGFMSAAVDWVRAWQPDIVLVSNPLQQVGHHHARELYGRIKSLGVKVGVMHHDIPFVVQSGLLRAYMDGPGDWEVAAGNIERDMAKVIERHPPLEAYFLMGSPLFFEPDFVLSCSQWSARFIDPLSQVPRHILHPFLDHDYWCAEPPAGRELPRRDVLMVNPQSRKGPVLMHRLIEDACTDWTFRVLKGSWGDAFATFRPRVESLPAFQQGRVEMLEYVYDMRAAYRAAGVVFFPSFIEGYGMTAVEPMHAGVPVVSSNYPAILEAVGDGAFTLCPYRTDRSVWRDAVRTVLEDPEPWRRRSLARAEELGRRQVEELDGLVGFMRGLL